MTERVGLLERAKAAARAHLDDAEQRSFDKLLGEIAALDLGRADRESAAQAGWRGDGPGRTGPPPSPAQLHSAPAGKSTARFEPDLPVCIPALTWWNAIASPRLSSPAAYRVFEGGPCLRHQARPNLVFGWSRCS